MKNVHVYAIWLFPHEKKSSKREKGKDLGRIKIKQIKNEGEDKKTKEERSQYESTKSNNQICNMKLNAFLCDSKSSMNIFT